MADIIVADNTPRDIDPNEVLREYGLEDVAQTSTVVQQENGTTVTIPEGSTLTPPPIEGSTTSNIDHELDALANEMLNIASVPSDALNQDSGEPPVDLDAEEDEDWDRLEEEGVIAVAAAPNALAHTEVDTATINNTPEPNETTPLDTPEPETPEVPAVPETPAQPVTAEDAINMLPVNSMSYANDDTMSRFSGAMWFNAIQLSTVVLAGLGGIGSYVLFCLARMKPKQVFLYDDDVVELANLSGQLYSAPMVGKRKVDAMAELARDFSCYYGVQAVPQKFTKDTPAGDIMICGFDNMQARKDFFEAWVKHLVNHPSPSKCLFIDGRLNMEEFQVFCMRGNDTYSIEKYHKEYLFEDYQAESLQCSMKQTTYCANMIGSVIVNLFTNFIANQLKPLIDRDVPFKTYYDASMMYFKTEE
jgi:molybdopterin/thiamine biosynthesis adenylyltransferase